MRRRAAAGVLGVVLVAMAAALALQPAPLVRAGHWLRYQATGQLPPPIVAGRNGRLFLGNHEGGEPGALLRDTCGAGVDGAAVTRAAADLRPLLAAGRGLPVPFRLLIVPTAPRIYPEDVPPGVACTAWPADRLVAALDDPDVLYPVAAMQAMKARFDVLPKRHFHWAGEGPLRVAEWAAASLGLKQTLTLELRPDNRASDLNQFYPGAGLHDRIGTPDLRRAGVSQCWGTRCDPALPASIVQYARPGPGRLLILADSFGDEFGGDWTEYAGTVWLVRMNLAVAEPPEMLAAVLHRFAPDAVVAVYHDAGAMAFDPASQNSLAAAARLLTDARLPPAAAAP